MCLSVQPCGDFTWGTDLPEKAMKEKILGFISLLMDRFTSPIQPVVTRSPGIEKMQWMDCGGIKSFHDTTAMREMVIKS